MTPGAMARIIADDGAAQQSRRCAAAAFLTSPRVAAS
jgi:hypothetical protein